MNWGGTLWGAGWGVLPRHWNPYLLNFRGTHPCGLSMGIRPPGFEVLAFSSLDQHNFTPNTPFCILDVWQGLIRVVVLHLLSRGTNFRNNKHSRNCTQNGLVSLRKVRTSWPPRTSSAYFANSCTCNLFLSSFLVLISKRNYQLAQ